MAFNKSKALEAALKSLNQGRVPDAIREYQQILRQDSLDQVTLMTLGDLFVRQGDLHQATEYFERLAHVYLNDGFNSKAIAIYKKIAKLAPNELDPLERLADLYVQQGVLSEARPLFLQIAEGHLKANRAPRAVEVLRRLLEVEPENLRVQMRLAELYNVIGQKAEAAKTYINYAQRLMERGDFAEVEKLCDRALEVEPSNLTALKMKAQALGASGNLTGGVALLQTLPDAEVGGETTSLILNMLLQAGDYPQATGVARRVLEKNRQSYAFAYRVCSALLQGSHPEEAFTLLKDIREPMIEGGEQDHFLETLTATTQALPGETGPLEALVAFCRETSDSFRLPDALSQLAQAYADAGQFDRAEGLLQELLERKPDDDKFVARLNDIRARAAGGTGVPSDSNEEASVDMTPVQAFPEEPKSDFAAPEAAEETASVPAEPALDPDTQGYIAQALTDVDLFSSYGLTQKATNLLEGILQRAPRHTPALERLLDINLGSGNERRTAEIAAQLEQIHTERGDNASAERFAELRKRFEGAAASAPPPQAAATPEPKIAAPSPPQEFGVAVTEPEVESAATTQPAHTGDEVDLSSEWESLSQEPVEEIPAATVTEAATEAPAEERATESVEAQAAEEPAAAEAAAPETAEATAEEEFELVPAEPVAAAAPAEIGPMTSGEFLSDLASEFGMEEEPATAAEPTPAPVVAAASNAQPQASANATEQATAASVAGGAGQSEANLNELEEVFQEFRNELGEMSDEDEDLETHYNLGIAYREMGLLDEAISEFQKVAKAIQRGKPFRYAMQCSTLLGLTFIDKGEPHIATLWYSRALETPGIDQETILALRYDLGLAQEMSGDRGAALNSFRQVYAVNIDYRDVAERIATLQKR